MAQTEEQRKRAFQDVGLTPLQEAGVMAGASLNPSNLITGEVLTPTPSLNIVQPKQEIIPPIDKLDTTTPDLQLTVPEQEESLVNKSLRELTQQLTDESSFRAEQEKAVGLQELQKTQQDLSSRLKAIQNEAQAIPLQLQQQAEGRGITKAGLQPIETAALRNNAIQALSISSLLEASRGNITLAQDQVDRAVSAKYDPIREKINALKTNLQLIIDSPEYKVADKNRAKKQLEIQDAKARALDEEQGNYNAILNLAMNVAATNKASSSQIEQIRSLLNNPTPENLIKAQQLAAPFLQKPKELETQVVEVDGRKKLVNTQTGEIIQDLGASDSGSGTTKLTPENRRNLIGSGLTDSMISNIEEGVRTIGIEEVLKDSYNDTQKDAIRKVYGIETKEITSSQILEAARAMKQSDVENYFRSRYTDDELSKMARDAGFAALFSGKATEVLNWLKSPKARERLAELLKTTYKESGYTIK